MTRLDPIGDERGTTLVELLIATATGLVVLSALTAAIVVTLHGSARVSARVDATQRARVVLTNIVEELHSACVAPKIAPVQATSSGTLLKFVHASPAEGAVAAPNPTLTEIVLANGTLSQTDYAATGGTAPSWTFSPTPIAPGTRKLMTHVAPIAPSTGVFSYYAYANGALSETPLATPLSAADAGQTVQVRVALTASAGNTPAADKGGPGSVQDSATLRLTPPSFNEQAVSLPCQ